MHNDDNSDQDSENPPNKINQVEIEMECEPSFHNIQAAPAPENDQAEIVENLAYLPSDSKSPGNQNYAFVFQSPKNHDDEIRLPIPFNILGDNKDLIILQNNQQQNELQLQSTPEQQSNQLGSLKQMNKLPVTSTTTFTCSEETTTKANSTAATTTTTTTTAKTQEQIPTVPFNNLPTSGVSVSNNALPDETNISIIVENNSQVVQIQNINNNHSRLDESSRLDYSVLDYSQMSSKNQIGSSAAFSMSLSNLSSNLTHINSNLNQQNSNNINDISCLSNAGQSNKLIYSFSKIEKNSENEQHLQHLSLVSPIHQSENMINQSNPAKFFKDNKKTFVLGGGDPIEVEEREFVELYHCLDCNIDVRIRAKHCKICKRCVATHDHHCPWVANCIGERNHCYFWWFLLLQFTTLIFTITIVIIHVVQDKIKVEQIVAAIVDGVILIGFTVMVVSLLIYHTYLASQNMTTWEAMRWESISYLKEWPIHNGSPFSKGSIWKNIKLYCQIVRKAAPLIDWYIPKRKDSTNNSIQTNKRVFQITAQRIPV